MKIEGFKMKKLLAVFLIMTLTMSSFVGCGNSGAPEQDDTVKDETQKNEESNSQTNEDSEENADSGSEMKLATITIDSRDGSKKVEITYNATFYDSSLDFPNQGRFCLKSEAEAFFEKYDWPGVVAGGGEFWVYANYSKDDYYQERLDLCLPYNISVSEMKPLTISGKTAYVIFEDGNQPHVIFEIDNNVFEILLPSGEWSDEEILRDVGEFFVDAKVIG